MEVARGWGLVADALRKVDVTEAPAVRPNGRPAPCCRAIEAKKRKAAVIWMELPLQKQRRGATAQSS